VGGLEGVPLLKKDQGKVWAQEVDEEEEEGWGWWGSAWLLGVEVEGLDEKPWNIRVES